MVKYMVGIDGSDPSEKAFSMATKLGISDRDELILIGVAKKSKKPEKRAKLEAILAEHKTNAEGLFAKIEIVVEEGDAREVLAHAVEKYAIDVVVVGTRGLGTLKRLFLGSVSQYMVEHAACDVLVAR